MPTARDQFVATVARQTNPRTGWPYGRERAEAILDRGAENGRAERLRVAARKRRLLARVDVEIRKRGGKPLPKRPATPAASTVQARARAVGQYDDARRSYNELRRAIQAEGGLRGNRDYPLKEIPRELRRKPGAPGLAADVMSQVLSGRGLHYEGDVELFADIERRRERLTETHQQANRLRARHGPSVVCTDSCRNRLGQWERCGVAVKRAVTYCTKRLRDAIGRFK